MTKPEAKHTPGPWTLDESDWPMIVNPPDTYTSDKAALKAGHPWFIAQVDLPEGSSGEDALGNRAFANARLIAAAPDLLEAAKEAAGDLDIITRDMVAQEEPIDPQRALNLYRDTLAKLRAAIAKAENR